MGGAIRSNDRINGFSLFDNVSSSNSSSPFFSIESFRSTFRITTLSRLEISRGEDEMRKLVSGMGAH